MIPAAAGWTEIVISEMSARYLAVMSDMTARYLAVTSEMTISMLPTAAGHMADAAEVSQRPGGD